MKITFVFLLMLCLSGTTFAQLDFDVESILAEEVPDTVRASQANYFPDATVDRWEKHMANGQKNSVVSYAARFRGASNQLIRASYMEDGTGIKAVTIYTAANQFPSFIQTVAAQSYSNHTLMSGQKIELLSRGNVFFRLRLRRGVRSRPLIVYLNSEGEEIAPESLPVKIREK